MTVLNVFDVTLLYQEDGHKKKKNQCFLPLLHEYNAPELAESIIQKYELVELNHVPYMLT